MVFFRVCGKLLFGVGVDLIAGKLVSVRFGVPAAHAQQPHSIAELLDYFSTASRLGGGARLFASARR